MLEKITNQSISGNNVKSTPGQRLTGTVSQNKHVFDKLPELIAAAVNDIIDALQSVSDGDSGADCINVTPITGAAGTTVQSILETYKTMLDNVYTKSSIDDQLEDKADKTTVNLSVKSVSLEPSTGVMTFTRQDGTTFTIDTLMEKILVNFAYDGSTQDLVFTASDGTVQRISISDFITENEFANSSTVSFSVSDSGVVTAYIKEGSITDAFLSSALKTALIAYRDAAQTAATNAAASEANAGQYASNAAGSAATATQKATDAAGSATAAAGSASSADNSAKKSESYAVGGTNTRTGEDTDNSKYYKEQAELAAAAAETARDEAQAAVGGDFITSAVFNSHVNDTTKHVTADEKAAWNNKQDAVPGKGLSANDYDSTEKQKVANAADHVANSGIHVTETDKSNWNNKVDSVSGKGLSTNDYTNDEKQKVANMPANTNADLEGKANKAVYSEETLLAAGWNATAKTYSFESTYPAASYDLEMWLNSTATNEQADAFSSARIESVYGQNVAKARGEVPTIDIPVIIKVVAK